MPSRDVTDTPADRPTGESQPAAARSWTFLTNHAHVLLCLSRDGELTMRELAQAVGITERAVQAIIADLIDDGYLTRVKAGRRNTYTVHDNGRLRHPLESAHTVGELITALR
ncbi:helix-turn-helix transcriptional regulator [Nocardia higoensis]|uniref:helix-turn-helix transcriptional regulator n=1 Tax=Nocardia higoensis TaxID=228599 RepID=UPI000593CD0E|nr:winged helix-turn-helix domain-containing protein [Nocardia higoensis]